MEIFSKVPPLRLDGFSPGTPLENLGTCTLKAMHLKVSTEVLFVTVENGINSMSTSNKMDKPCNSHIMENYKANNL